MSKKHKCFICGEEIELIDDYAFCIACGSDIIIKGIDAYNFDELLKYKEEVNK